MADRNEMIAKVKALWAQADHPNTSETESRAFRDKAISLMAKYQIDEMVMSEASGVEDAIVFVLCKVDTIPARGIVVDQRLMLIHSISKNFDCRGIVKKTQGSADIETGKAIPGGYYYEIIGYRHDVDTVRMFYFNLVTDLLEALLVEEQKTSEVYRRSFAVGYAERINERLLELHDRTQEMADMVSSSMALAVRSKKSHVDEAFDKMYPPEDRTHVKTKGLSMDWNGTERGRRRAESANLGGTQAVAGRHVAGSLGTERGAIGR